MSFFGQFLEVFEKSVQDKWYDVHVNCSLLHGEGLHTCTLTLPVTFAVVFCIIVLLMLHLIIQHVPYNLLKISRPGFHNWLYMTFCWVSLLGSEYAWSDLNFILEVLCCKDVTCTCVLNRWRHWLHSLEGLHLLLVRGIGFGAYSERCKQFHNKYWRKNLRW